MAGASAIVFGFAHFNYIDFTASMVPGWIPFEDLLGLGHRGGHLADGLALVSGVQGATGRRLRGGHDGVRSWCCCICRRVIAAPGPARRMDHARGLEHAHRRRAAREEIRHNRGVSEEEDSKPVEVPHTELAPATLRAVIESFVLREGTDYGAQDVSFERKVADVMRQLERREAVIVYDPGSDSVDIVVAAAGWLARAQLTGLLSSIAVYVV